METESNIPAAPQITPEEIDAKVKPILEKYLAENESLEYLRGMKDIVRNAVANPESLKDAQALTDLSVAMLVLAAKEQKDIYPDIYRFARIKGLDEIISPESWLLREFHRVVATLCEPDDAGAIGDLILEPAVAMPVREQAILVFNYLWFENKISEKDIVEEHRRLLEQGLAPEDDWKLWMALVIHSAVIGGTKLKPQVMSIIDSGKMEGQTAFVRKIVNGLFSNSSTNFRDMLKKQHHGPFVDIDKELHDLFTPFKAEDVQMPEQGKPIHREEPKVGRNDPCPCGSGKKYKKCCGKDK